MYGVRHAGAFAAEQYDLIVLEGVLEIRARGACGQQHQAERLGLVLLDTSATRSYLEHAFKDDQVVLFGRESAGVPETVHKAADARLRIPIAEGLRSLNVAMAVALVAGEALRQTGSFPR